MPAKSGSRVISIREQPEALQNVIKAAVRMVTGDVISVNAYVSDAGITDYYQEVLVKCARELEYEFMCDRFQTDHSFCVVVGRLVCGPVLLLSDSH